MSERNRRLERIAKRLGVSRKPVDWDAWTDNIDSEMMMTLRNLNL